MVRLDGLVVLVVCAVCVHRVQSQASTDPIYGACGEPTMDIPHGGIRLYSGQVVMSRWQCLSNIYDPCEPKFYCDDNYHHVGEFDLTCTHDVETGVYEWTGPIPTCVEDYSGDQTAIIIPLIVGSVIFSLVLGVVGRIIRRRRLGTTQRGIVTRSTTVIVQQNPAGTQPSQVGRPSMMPRLNPGGGYARFDDSNVQVPQHPMPSGGVPHGTPPPYSASGYPPDQVVTGVPKA